MNIRRNIIDAEVRGTTSTKYGFLTFKRDEFPTKQRLCSSDKVMKKGGEENLPDIQNALKVKHSFDFFV